MNPSNSRASDTATVLGRNSRGCATILLADGRCVEIDPLRDACRAGAHQLRQEAMADLTAAIRAGLRRWVRAALHRLRPAFRTGLRIQRG